MSRKQVIFALAICTALLLSISVSSPRTSLVTPAKAKAVQDHASQEARSCSNATLDGTYGFQRNGQTSQGPITAVGLIVFDGRGNFVDQQTIARSGKFSTVTDQTGTYEVKPDCTGTETDPTGAVFATIVVVHNGGEVLGMSMTPGNNVAVHFERVTDPPQRVDRDAR